MAPKAKGRPVPDSNEIRRSTDPRYRLGRDTKQGQTFVGSGYGFQTREPFVELELPERAPLLLGLDDCRRVAQMMLEACEAAEQDAFLVEWAMEAMEIDLDHAIVLLHEAREARLKRRASYQTTSA